MMEKYIQVLKEYALSYEQNYGDGMSILTFLYETYNEANRMDNTRSSLTSMLCIRP